jgi:hypothetical protein
MVTRRSIRIIPWPPGGHGGALASGSTRSRMHELGLYRTEDAPGRLTDWLQRGELADRAELGSDELLTAAERSALVTVTRYTTQGPSEVAGDSTDLVLPGIAGPWDGHDRGDAGVDRTHALIVRECR